MMNKKALGMDKGQLDLFKGREGLIKRSIL
jgi:hypothetical protein